jgi:antitoxin (DNA-binding transcriptional repressor) of toxin-antitoxin stability system
MLQKIAKRFPGRRIEIISGQRVRKSPGHESYHNKGQALDFRVSGISNKTLVSFVRTFKNAGVGYYPNSVFIHMDTREKNAFWIDYARPGEKAIYGRRGMTVAEINKIRERRKQKLNHAQPVKNKKRTDTEKTGTKELSQLLNTPVKQGII